jgi:3',5'-cyclic AMP phosphodiesterase CpdA
VPPMLPLDGPGKVDCRPCGSDWSPTEGNAAALEAARAVLKKHAPDVLVHAGDVLCCPFSPDPPAETIGLLRAEGVRTILGNHDRYLVDWGTPR